MARSTKRMARLRLFSLHYVIIHKSMSCENLELRHDECRDRFNIGTRSTAGASCTIERSSMWNGYAVTFASWGRRLLWHCRTQRVGSRRHRHRRGLRTAPPLDDSRSGFFFGSRFLLYHFKTNPYFPDIFLIGTIWYRVIICSGDAAQQPREDAALRDDAQGHVAASILRR